MELAGSNLSPASSKGACWILCRGGRRGKTQLGGEGQKYLLKHVLTLLVMLEISLGETP